MSAERKSMIADARRSLLILTIGMALAALSAASEAAPAGKGRDASFCVLSVEEDGGSLTVLDPGGTVRA
jgi:hypothetical protein